MSLSKMNPVRRKIEKAKAVLAFALLFAAAVVCHAQGLGGGAQNQGTNNSAASSDRSGSGSSYSPSSSSLPSAPSGQGGQSPFTSSVPEGKSTGEVLPLSFNEAIDRALRNNLGLLLGSDNVLAARGQKWKELSALLPNVSAAATQSATQIDLAALGFRFNFPGISSVVGPIGTFDARTYLKSPIFNWELIQRERGAQAGESVAHFNYKSARELVVLAAGNEYLLTIASSARVDAAQAQVESAQALYAKAHDQQVAGVVPAIDALRAHVEFQTRQQQLIAARNDYAKQNGPRAGPATRLCAASRLSRGRATGAQCATLPPGSDCGAFAKLESRRRLRSCGREHREFARGVRCGRDSGNPDFCWWARAR
ncbi:MAG: hypothetical protein DMG93_10040 [Acidobacteria bacterium]|nr:MAG: hypothetical protein DMG93_10040 [Acidobacteriota bacterium]